MLVGRADGLHDLAGALEVAVGLGLEHQAAAVVVPGQAALVLHAQEPGPVVPVEEAFVGEGAAVVGRVVGADDGAGGAGRAVARGRQLLHHQRLAPGPAEREGGGGADNPGADDDHVVAVGHGALPPELLDLPSRQIGSFRRL